jgi:hypothetical protein
VNASARSQAATTACANRRKSALCCFIEPDTSMSTSTGRWRRGCRRQRRVTISPPVRHASRCTLRTSSRSPLRAGLRRRDRSVGSAAGSSLRSSASTLRCAVVAAPNVACRSTVDQLASRPAPSLTTVSGGSPPPSSPAVRSSPGAGTSTATGSGPAPNQFANTGSKASASVTDIVSVVRAIQYR